MATITKRATALVKGGNGFSNISNIYDSDVNTYAQKTTSNSINIQINKFGFNFPVGTVINSVTVATKVYTSNSYGYVSLRLFSDLNASSSYSMAYENILNGKKQTIPTYYTYTYTGAELEAKLKEYGLHNGDVRTWLNDGFQVYLRGGSDSSYGTCTCRIYDNYVTVDYTTPIVTYDSIFSFQKWKNSGIVSGNSATISSMTDTGFTITAGVNDSYTGESPFFPVTPGNKYTMEYDCSGTGNEVFVFYHTSDSVSWSSFTNSTDRKFDFTVPSGNPYITIRCDSNIQGNAVNYSNFRIYPASETYMSNSVSDSERSDIVSWSMPIPQREGYTFLGWYTGINGSGTKYTASSAFPTGDLVLYSAWEAKQYYLDLNGFIDDASTGGISPAGTADVYINGTLASDDCTDYWTQHYYGSTYEVKDIRANPGYRYVGVKSGSLSGTITGDTAVVLEFERLPPEITDVKITYGSQPVSKLNKVPCGEGFILSVGVGYSNSILG